MRKDKEENHRQMLEAFVLGFGKSSQKSKENQIKDQISETDITASTTEFLSEDAKKQALIRKVFGKSVTPTGAHTSEKVKPPIPKLSKSTVKPKELSSPQSKEKKFKEEIAEIPKKVPEKISKEILEETQVYHLSFEIKEKEQNYGDQRINQVAENKKLIQETKTPNLEQGTAFLRPEEKLKRAQERIEKFWVPVLEDKLLEDTVQEEKLKEEKSQENKLLEDKRVKNKAVKSPQQRDLFSEASMTRRSTTQRKKNKIIAPQYEKVSLQGDSISSFIRRVLITSAILLGFVGMICVIVFVFFQMNDWNVPLDEKKSAPSIQDEHQDRKGEDDAYDDAYIDPSLEQETVGDTPVNDIAVDGNDDILGEEEQNIESDKNYEINLHVVSPGETLSQISMKYYGTVKGSVLIQEWNQLSSSDQIKIGQELEIPIPK